MKNIVKSKLFEKFNDAGYTFYLVGGAVRDELMGKEPSDLDFATNARPEEIINLIGGKQIGFATILINTDGEKAEISTYRRKEVYFADSRVPEVEFGDTIRDDLARRDFTINAIAYDKYGIIDPYNGREDIKNKIIRLTNNNESVLIDDPLRMLRAIRFVSKLGFVLHYNLQTVITKNAYRILYVSRERWLMEMDKILLGDYVEKALDIIVWLGFGISKYILPEVERTLFMNQGDRYHYKNVWDHTKLVVKNVRKNKNLKWAALLHDLGKPATKSIKEKEVHFYKHELVSEKLAKDICDRFKMSNKDRKEIVFLVANHMKIMTYVDKWKDSAVRRFILHAGDYLDNLITLAKADITSLNPRVIKICLDNITTLENRIDKLKEEKKAEPRLISRKKFKEIIENTEQIKGKAIGWLKEVIEQGIVDSELSIEASNEEMLSYYFKKEKKNGTVRYAKK